MIRPVGGCRACTIANRGWTSCKHPFGRDAHRQLDGLCIELFACEFEIEPREEPCLGIDVNRFSRGPSISLEAFTIEIEGRKFTGSDALAIAAIIFAHPTVVESWP